MKLELKHLSPYFPYGLKIYVYGQTRFEDYTCEIERLEKGGQVYFSHEWNNIDNSEYFKPILRPLSDLTKEIDHNGEKFIPSVILYDEYSMRMDSDNDPYFDYYHIGGTDSPFTGYWCVHRMIEWHFDVFDLIPSGLAIDINQTNPSPSH